MFDGGLYVSVAAGEVQAHGSFDDAQVRGGADRKKFGEAFDDAEEDGQQVMIQKQIPRCVRNENFIRAVTP